MNRRNVPDFDVVLKGETDFEPVLRFEDSNLHRLLAQKLFKIFAREIPTSIQKFSIPAVAKGLDVIGLSQTGSGKTGAYLIPILDHLFKNVTHVSKEKIKPIVLILTPTRELALQICDDAKKIVQDTYIICRSVYGGIKKRAQLAAFENGVHILTATPGRLQDHLKEVRPGFIIDLSSVRTVVIDEADHMLECDFRIMEEIFAHPTFPPLKNNMAQMLFFSATTSQFLEKAALGMMKKNKTVIIECGEIGRASSYIDQQFLNIPEQKKGDKIIDLLNELPMKTLIFVNCIEKSEQVTLFLKQNSLEPSMDRETIEGHIDRLKAEKTGTVLDKKFVADIDQTICLLEKKLISCKNMSSTLDQAKRERILRQFKDDKIKCVVATDVACRGLHIPGPLHVINYDMPRTGSVGDRVRAYVHRIGRTGRMGENGRATSFFNPQLDGQLGPDMYWQLIDRQQIVPEIILQYQNDAKSRGPPKTPKGSKKASRKAHRPGRGVQAPGAVDQLTSAVASVRLQ